MADNNTIARPYAQAIFDIAQESGEIDKWANSLEHGKAILADDQLLEFLSKPSLSSEQKFTFITSIFAEIPDEKMIFSSNHNAGSNFIKLLIENSRIAVFPEIAKHFTALKSNIENLIFNLQNETPDNSFSESDLVSKVMSKSMSIKNGKILNLNEQQYIFNALFACKETMVCPFNKKTFVKIDYSQIDNMFK